MSLPSIPQFYSGRSVLITGGTGFMGKVLIERLLATCPSIGRIHILMRPKRNLSPQERLNQLKKCQVFDNILQKYPWQLDKLSAVPGDVTQLNIGLSTDSVALLNEVSIVFHSAANVKFDETLRIAVNHNLKPVIELMDICDRLPRLEVFIYVSTAYSNAERNIISEKVYPPPVILEELLNFVKNSPDILLQEETRKYIHPKPNTYTFTKAMGESVVAQRSKYSKYSTAIFRPTIVVSSLKHPFPGWIENLNGPSGLIVGIGKGLLHVSKASESVRSDQLPVDIAIDNLIAVSWEIAIDKPKETRVYNCSSMENPTTNREFKEAILKYLRIYPLGKPLWYPFVIVVKNKFLFKILESFLQTLPLCMVGYILRLFRIKMSENFVKASQKLISMSEVLAFFITREWVIDTNNMHRLQERLTKKDSEVFNLDPKSIVWDKYYSDFVRGTRQYLIKRSDCILQSDRRFISLLKILHYSVIIKIVWYIIKTMKNMIPWLKSKFKVSKQLIS